MRTNRMAVALAAIAAASVAWGRDDDSKDRRPPDPADPKKQEAQDDLPTRDLKAGADERMRYLVHGPKKDAKEPKSGWRVLYVLR